MATVKVYPEGIRMGTPPGRNNHPRALRGKVVGWTPAASRRNQAFLFSVVVDRLTGSGYAVTLTVAKCPPSAAAWTALRRAYLMRLTRLGMIRAHWVTEWQQRRVPHLHLAVFFPPRRYDLPNGDRVTDLSHHLREVWLELAAEFGAGYPGQHVRHIDGALGWLKYLAKHAARGVSHYQRASASVPPEWQSAGRLWGHVGEWPAEEPMEFEIDRAGRFALRRITRHWAIAEARSRREWRMVRVCRDLHSQPDRSHSEVRGISHWIPRPISLKALDFLRSQGHRIEQ